MNLVKCPNGHFYDATRFGDKCPMCGMSGYESVGDQTTVPLNLPIMPEGQNGGTAGYTVEEKTEPLNTTIPNEGTTYTPPTSCTPPAYVQDDDKTIPVPSDMLDGVFGAQAPVVGWLVCVSGVNKGRAYDLHQGRNFIGRSHEMDVHIIGDNTVSRSSHAIVVYDPRSNIYLAQPGDSKELFYLNNELILNPTKLKAHDELMVGNTKLMFIPLCDDDFHW